MDGVYRHLELSMGILNYCLDTQTSIDDRLPLLADFVAEVGVSHGLGPALFFEAAGHPSRW